MDDLQVHINNICERNYVKIESGRRVVPTEVAVGRPLRMPVPWHRHNHCHRHA
jgi:hypothetical protein